MFSVPRHGCARGDVPTVKGLGVQDVSASKY
jgi:hypothetical protein